MTITLVILNSCTSKVDSSTIVIPEKQDTDEENKENSVKDVEKVTDNLKQTIEDTKRNTKRNTKKDTKKKVKDKKDLVNQEKKAKEEEVKKAIRELIAGVKAGDLDAVNKNKLLLSEDKVKLIEINGISLMEYALERADNEVYYNKAMSLRTKDSSIYGTAIDDRTFVVAIDNGDVKSVAYYVLFVLKDINGDYNGKSFIDLTRESTHANKEKIKSVFEHKGVRYIDDYKAKLKAAVVNNGGDLEKVKKYMDLLTNKEVKSITISDNYTTYVTRYFPGRKPEEFPITRRVDKKLMQYALDRSNNKIYYDIAMVLRDKDTSIYGVTKIDDFISGIRNGNLRKTAYYTLFVSKDINGSYGGKSYSEYAKESTHPRRNRIISMMKHKGAIF